MGSVRSTLLTLVLLAQAAVQNDAQSAGLRWVPTVISSSFAGLKRGLFGPIRFAGETLILLRHGEGNLGHRQEMSGGPQRQSSALPMFDLI